MSLGGAWPGRTSSVAEVQFTADAVADLEELDGSTLRLVLRKLKILEADPEAGQPLGSRQTSNLTGFRKLVIGNRTHRAVYRVESNEKICVIWVIAGRVDASAMSLRSSVSSATARTSPRSWD